MTMNSTRTKRMVHMAGELSSTRVITDEGYLRVTATISTEGVFPFRSNELDGPDGATDIEWVYISPEVLFDPKTISDISILPTTLGHPGPDVGPENYAALSTGHVMAGTVRKVGPGNSLGCDLLFTRPDAIAGIEDHSIEEISLGFYADVKRSDGEFEGQKYTKQFVRPLNTNHIAQVPKGRAGPQVRIHNAMPEWMTTNPVRGRDHVRALMKAQIKRVNMAELTPQDMEEIIWSNPEKEVAASHLAAREADRKTVRDLGPAPNGGPNVGPWVETREENKLLYEREIRRRVRQVARTQQIRGLLSVALATGVTAVLADHIWDTVSGSLGNDPPRMDMVPPLLAARRFPAFDAAGRFSGRIIRGVFDNPMVQSRLHRDVMRETRDTLEMSGDIVPPRNTWNSIAANEDNWPDLNATSFDGAIAELEAQRAKAFRDIYSQKMEAAQENLTKYVRGELAVMLTTLGGIGVGSAYLTTKLDEIKDKALEWIGSGSATGGDRADMQAGGAAGEDPRIARVKRRLKKRYSRGKTWVSQGFCAWHNWRSAPRRASRLRCGQGHGRRIRRLEWVDGWW